MHADRNYSAERRLQNENDYFTADYWQGRAYYAEKRSLCSKVWRADEVRWKQISAEENILIFFFFVSDDLNSSMSDTLKVGAFADHPEKTDLDDRLIIPETPFSSLLAPRQSPPQSTPPPQPQVGFLVNWRVPIGRWHFLAKRTFWRGAIFGLKKINYFTFIFVPVLTFNFFYCKR